MKSDFKVATLLTTKNLGIALLVCLLLFFLSLFHYSSIVELEKEQILSLKTDIVLNKYHIDQYQDSLRTERKLTQTLQDSLWVVIQKNIILEKELDIARALTIKIIKEYNINKEKLSRLKKEEEEKGFWGQLSDTWNALWK